MNFLFTNRQTRMALSPADYSGTQEGGKRRGVSVKKLKRALKKAGLKTTGKKSTLRARAKKAHLKLKGGADVAPEVKEQLGGVVETIKKEEEVDADVGGRRHSRRHRKGRRHTRR